MHHHSPARATVWPLSLLLSLLFLLFALDGSVAQAQEAYPAAPPYTLFAPIIGAQDDPEPADRMGFAAGQRPLDQFPNIEGLNAGWYVDWTVKENPLRPGGLEHVQMVRVHQEIDTTVPYNRNVSPWVMCGRFVTADRTICPYADPPSYSTRPTPYRIQVAALARPGALWLIGNEMDRMDFYGGGQDEMMPELYAVAYHDIYHLIKEVDPTARVAIGGVIQATPLRLQYLDTVWNTYRATYGVEMPVDVWNVHNFIGSEYCDRREKNGRQEYTCFSMAIPPGADLEEAAPAYIRRENLHISREVFDRQIRAFRAWMKAKGEMDKPLIVTEYGVLHQNLCPQTDPEEKQRCIDAWDDQPGGFVDLADPDVVHDFMIWTFDYFMSTRDCSLSAVDGCRLVQRWAWFSLDGAGTTFNIHGSLYGRSGRTMTEAGRLYSEFATENWQALRYDGP